MMRWKREMDRMMFEAEIMAMAACVSVARVRKECCAGLGDKKLVVPNASFKACSS